MVAALIPVMVLAKLVIPVIVHVHAGGEIDDDGKSDQNLSHGALHRFCKETNACGYFLFRPFQNRFTVLRFVKRLVEWPLEILVPSF